jgi:DeoR/GlpR family transcriptional regulator of sugar metabolism
MIEVNGRISVGEIQELFEVSVDSARRDLRLLEEQGLLKRTHGGAIPNRQVAGFSRPPTGTFKESPEGQPYFPRHTPSGDPGLKKSGGYELPLRPVLDTPAPAARHPGTYGDLPTIKENYMAVAKRAVSEVQDNDVVFITSATLGYFMVQSIPDNLKLRVITNSILLAEELQTKDHISVILLGGEMDRKGCCYDAFAVNMIRELRFDKCFLTAACISADFGLSIQKSNAKPFWNAVIDSSKKTYGLFPTEKIGFESIVSICPAKRLDTLITDWDAPEEELRKFDEQGIEVIVAEKAE